MLLDNGIGTFRFADSGTAVIEGVTAVIGGWDYDSSDSDSVTLPNCDDGVARIVSWGSLVLTFVERTGAESFTGWSYGFDPLTGDSVDTYGDTVSILDNAALDAATFHIAGSGSTQLAGKLDSAGSEAIVDFLETTPGC